MRRIIALVLALAGGAYALWFAQVLSENYHVLIVPIMMHAAAVSGMVGAGLVLVRPGAAAVVMAGAALGVLMTLSVDLGLIPAALLALGALLGYLEHQAGAKATLPAPPAGP